MQCDQCGRPALYKITEQEFPLCLHCFHKWQSIQNMQFLQNAAMMNQALDDMDMISGISLGGNRVPVAAIATAMAQRAHVYNNIVVTNSNVGVINTGDLAKIDATITITEGSDAELIGQQLKLLTQAVVDTNDLNDHSKKELIELLQSLSEQIVSGRKKSVMLTLLKAIEERAKGANAVAQLATSLASAIMRLFAAS